MAEGVATAADALAGARDIVAETIADTAEVRAFVRGELADHGELISEVVPGQAPTSRRSSSSTITTASR